LLEEEQEINSGRNELEELGCRNKIAEQMQKI
jgi:hypothetical protein